MSALAAMAMQAASAPSRLFDSASTSAPPGNWLTMAVMVPTLSAAPMEPWVQAALLR